MTDNSNLPTIVSSPLMNPDTFGHMQRVANVLALSPLFPDHLRKGSKEQALANGVLVLNMAMRLNEDPLTVAQNIYFVGGKPGWSASYMISKANQHGVFKNPIDWNVTGKGESLSVTAVAEIAATGKKVSVTCDMEMANAEGWTKNAKYKSMPEQMLRYRSATFLIRLYCPEVMVGVPATIELSDGDYKDVTPAEYADMAAQPAAKVEPEIEDAKEVEDEPAPKEEKADAEEKKPEPKKEAKASAEHRKIAEQITGDLDDGAPIEATLNFYAEALDKMKAEAPEFHAEVMESISAYEKAA